MKLRVFFEEKRDDLTDYAEAIAARLMHHAIAKPISAQDFGAFRGAVVNRTGRLQAELLHIPPGVRLPPHSHPDVDSIDLLVTGNVASFTIGGARVARFAKGLGLRIAADAVHGGVANEEGVAFISCQRWRDRPTHIGLCWRGAPSSETHLRLLEQLEAVA